MGFLFPYSKQLMCKVGERQTGRQAKTKREKDHEKLNVV